MQRKDHSTTNIPQAMCENGLLYLLRTPKPKRPTQCRLADITRNVGIRYWIPVPAKEPVNSISTPMSSKKYVSSSGGITVTIGNSTFLNTKLYDSRREVSKKRLWRLFLNVMAIIGKLVESVNTGKRARKYSTISRKIFSLSVGTKLSVYRSLSRAKAKAPVNARSR